MKPLITNDTPVQLAGTIQPDKARRLNVKQSSIKRSNTNLQRCTDFQIERIELILNSGCEHAKGQECQATFVSTCHVINTQGHKVTYNWQIKNITPSASIGSIPDHTKETIQGTIRAKENTFFDLVCTATCNGVISEMTLQLETEHTEV